MKNCDIIIPIYNAYECVIECVDSVVKNTDLKNNRLILINDKSPDERISKLLKDYRKKYKDFIILENQENKGFVGTVNIGMQQSKTNDVLLLNSDTVVTPHWIDNIKKCAYSGEKIATVTPLSNNATMASVPIPFNKNELPDGITIDDMAKIVEENSFLDYPDLPTGHGFCLYIKREVLDKLGYFDEDTFGKGYGEENDFCFRCLDIGYRNLLCDNAYVYHKESQSFSESKIALMKSGGEKLEKRYPTYTKRLNEWCRGLPIRYIGNNVGFAMREKTKKHNILIIIHDWNDIENHLGGTTLHVFDIISKLRNKYNFHVLAPIDNTYRLTSYWTNSESVLNFPHFYDSRTYQFYNNDYKKMVNDIVQDFAIDCVHIHHMKNHYFDLIDIIKDNNLKTYLSLHDFYCVCPLINKMYCNSAYCGNPSIEKCNECMFKTQGFVNNMILEWRTEWKKLFEVCSSVITPTNSCKEEILLTYKDLKIKVIEHGVNIEKKKQELNIENAEKMEVGFLGAIGIIKGSNILNDLLTNKKYKNINFHLFGTYDRILNKKMKKKINDHGKYKREELPELLENNNIKLICLLSICPETYSYTLTESIANGIPVLVSDMGALKERVEKDNLGWTIDLNVDDPAQVVIDKIKEIQANASEYQEKIKSIQKYKIKTVASMVKEYDKIYATIKENDLCLNNERIQSQIQKSDKYISYVNYADYAWVFDTFKWKLISKIKIPTKVKKVFRRNVND